MAKFRGIVQGDDKTETSRLGHRLLTTQAQSWEGKVVTQLWEDDDGIIQARVSLESHQGAGTRKVLYDGPVNPEAKDSG